MKIDKKELETLTAELSLTIEKEDYLPDYKEKLKSFQQQSHMKGFRKGKTPMSLVKKMYGAQTMQEAVSKVLGEKINEIITGDEFEIIGEPLFLDEDNIPEIDPSSPSDYTYRFEIGIEPEFEVKGADASDSYTMRKVVVSDEMINEEIDIIKRRMGEQIEMDDVIQKDDVVYVEIKEMEGTKIKEGGHMSDFNFNIDNLTDKYQKSLLKMKKGDSFELDIYDFEKDLTPENVDKYLLKFESKDGEEKPGKDYSAEITKVIRVKEAAFDQDLFDKYFGKDAVKSEEEAKDKIKSYMSDHFNNESTNLLNREIMQNLVDSNSFELPVNFIKKWVNKEQEMPEDQFDSFLKELKWRIIKKKLVKKHEVQVEEQEILNYFVNAIRSYSPYIDENTLRNTAFSLMKNREQVNTAIESISSGKLFEEIRKVVSIEESDISKDDFAKKVKEINEMAK